MKEIKLAFDAAGEFKSTLVSLVLAGFILSLLEAATLLFLFSFVTFLVAPDASPSRLLQPLFAWLGGFNAPAQATLILALATLRYLLGLRQEWRMARLWVEMRGHMQETMLDMHLHSRYGFLVRHKLGEHIHNILESPGLAAVFYHHLVRFLSTCIMLVILFATLLAISPVLLSIAVGIGLIYLLIIRAISSQISYKLGVQRSGAIKKQMELVTEGIAGVRYLKLLLHYPEWLREFSSATAIATNVMHRSGFWNTFPARTLEYLVILFFMGMVLNALEGWTTFRISSIPTIAVYFLGIVRVLPSLYILGSGRTEMMQVLPNLKRFVELKNTLPQETTQGGTTDIPSLSRNAIYFKDVGFSYGDQLVLEAFNLQLNPRSIIAIAGVSGQGKSTMFDLLLRLIEPSHGQICVDSKNIGEFNLPAWRNKFAYVGQDPFLFHTTVRENIRLGNPAASDAEMARAIDLACVPEFANDMPHGLDTILADGGRSLSGGQRQRVALARALVSAAEVLLLDEPTSALDPDTERRVLTGVLSQSGHRTVILVTHRQDVLKYANQIVVLHEGRIRESGSYDELMASGVHFKRIFQAP